MQFCLNKKKPLFKSKYSLVTDREKYCEGTLKKILKKGDENWNWLPISYWSIWIGLKA